MGVPVGTSGLPNHLFPLKILTLKDFTVILLKWLRNCWRFSSIILIEFNLKRLSMSILIEGSTILNTEIIYMKVGPQIAFILITKNDGIKKIIAVKDGKCHNLKIYQIIAD